MTPDNVTTVGRFRLGSFPEPPSERFGDGLVVETMATACVVGERLRVRSLTLLAAAFATFASEQPSAEMPTASPPSNPRTAGVAEECSIGQ